jgi:hypothetical protein
MAYFEERIVSARELDLLVPMHRNRWLRPQIEAKMAGLNPADPIQHELGRLVSLCLDLLEAVDAGVYRKPSHWAQIEPWLRRSLAYFVNQHDAIPDHFEDGFEDDHREFRQLADRLGLLLIHFEGWRKRHRA